MTSSSCISQLRVEVNDAHTSIKLYDQPYHLIYQIQLVTESKMVMTLFWVLYKENPKHNAKGW